MATPTQARSKPLAALAGRSRPGLISLVGLSLVALLLFWLAVNLVKEPADFVEVALIGLTTGCLYALIALGYTLVYGILELINFAHGDVFMLGGMISATRRRRGLRPDRHRAAASATWLLVVATLLIAMVACGADQRDDRARRLPAAPQRAAARAADHRDRRLLHPPERRARVEGPELRLGAGRLPAQQGLLDRRRRLPVEQADRRADHRPGAARARLARAVHASRGRRCARPRRTWTPRR